MLLIAFPLRSARKRERERHCPGPFVIIISSRCVRPIQFAWQVHPLMSFARAARLNASDEVWRDTKKQSPQIDNFRFEVWRFRETK